MGVEVFMEKPFSCNFELMQCKTMWHYKMLFLYLILGNILPAFEDIILFCNF